MKRHPVWTWGACAIALAVWFLPPAGEWLALDRQALLGGQVWRLVTGHLVHFSWSHLLMNLAAFAVTAGLLESCTPVRRTILFLAVPAIISLALLLFEPAMARYGGLSGLGTATLAWLALYSIRFDAPAPRWLAMIAFGALLIKMVCEWSQSAPLFAVIERREVVTVPASHLVGGLLALFFFTATVNRRREIAV